MIEKFGNTQIKPRLYVVFVLLLCFLRLAIAISQRVFLMPGGAGLDDGLMFSAAQSVVVGDWLGAYTGLSMAKTMGFSLWLAFVHLSAVPYLVANALLWLLCSAFAAWALRPLTRGNLFSLLAFALFAFLPTSFADFTMRVYRDSIFSAFCLLLFAGVLGLALRKKEHKMRGRWFAASGVGLGLVGVFLLREDGLVLLPFAVCGLALLLLYALKNQEVFAKKNLVLQCVLPFVILAGGVLSFSLVNYFYYGVFMLNDNTDGTFPKAYGAIVAVAQAESEFEQFVPVPNEALDKLLSEVPSLEKLTPALEEGAVYNGFYDKERGAYGGSFYYALRLAAEAEGLTPTAEAAQAYWAQVQSEVEAAVSEGRLQSVTPGQSTVPPWNATLFWPTVQEFFSSLKMTLLFEEINPRPRLSEGEYQNAEEMAAWLNTVPQEPVYEANSDVLYLSVTQKGIFLLCDLLIWLYRILIWPLLVVSLWKTGKALWQGSCLLVKKRRFSERCLFSLLSFGLLLSYFLRLAVAAYLEVSAFNIGTYLMYLASGMPALLLFCVFGALQKTTVEEDCDGCRKW